MCLLISATDCTVGRKTWIDSRAVMIPGLESASESHFGFFWTSDHDDSDSGSFSIGQFLQNLIIIE